MSALEKIVLEGEVLPPLEDKDVTESDKVEDFLFRHQQTCGNYWCSRGIDPCIRIVPNG